MKTKIKFTVYIFSIFLSLFSMECNAQLFDGNVWINSSNGNIIKVSNILSNPTQSVICNTEVMGDIGFSPEGELYGALRAFPYLSLIDTLTGQDSTIFELPISNLNSLSFDENGRAYLGSAGDSKVVWVDISTNPISSGIWNDFGNGNASGDFIFMNNKVYVAWVSDDAEYLYEVSIDANNNYVSHTNLGRLPTQTWGLASDGANIVFSVSSDNKVYSITPPTNPTGIVPATLLYTCAESYKAYGASSKAESLGNANLDYGDAPIPFPTYDSLSGAVHLISPFMCLGPSVDKDENGQPTPDATGDDNDAEGNDDDGVLMNGAGLQNASLVSGSTVQLEVICSGTGWLNAWIDWNGDGDWSDDGEKFIVDTLLQPGNHMLPVIIPQTIQDNASFCRFRFSTISELNYEGYAPDGEVEDYKVNLVKCTSSISVNSDSLKVIPTTCGGNIGAITGLEATGNEPLIYEWENQTGEIVGSTLNIYHLGVGYYSLKITDSNGCANSVCAYSIGDSGNILIDTAIGTDESCSNRDGTVTITAISGLSSMLQYFIQTGNDTLSQWGNGVFTGLPGGVYSVWVNDSIGCKSLYLLPLILEDHTAPVIVSATTTPETGSSANGTITVIASGIGLTYMLNGSVPFSNGYFNGLPTGDYSITVENTYGCDTTFTVSIGHESGITLSAIAGDGFACLGKEAKAPLVVGNFRNVQSFETILNYDKNAVNVVGYSNLHPQLADSIEVSLFPLSGKILTRWKGATPLTLPDTTEIVQFVFSSLLPGDALLLWDISPAVSNFIGPDGDTLDVNYAFGTIRISNPPHILTEPEIKVCEGSFLLVSGFVQNGTDPLIYQWQTPTGPTTQESILKTATLADEGLYELIVTDAVLCADTSSVLVSVIPIPVSGFPADSDTLYFTERIQLEAIQGYDSYTWNTGDTTNSILVTSEGWYKVTIATDEGCTTIDSVFMRSVLAPLAIPNAFTPDGDGLNDVFRLLNLPETMNFFSMYIYDRWGKLAFFSNDANCGWDGKINGTPAQTGEYVYFLKYANTSGATEKRGVVILVR